MQEIIAFVISAVKNVFAMCQASPILYWILVLFVLKLVLDAFSTIWRGISAPSAGRILGGHGNVIVKDIDAKLGAKGVRL